MNFETGRGGFLPDYSDQNCVFSGFKYALAYYGSSCPIAIDGQPDEEPEETIIYVQFVNDITMWLISPEDTYFLHLWRFDHLSTVIIFPVFHQVFHRRFFRGTISIEQPMLVNPCPVLYKPHHITKLENP